MNKVVDVFKVCGCSLIDIFIIQLSSRHAYPLMFHAKAKGSPILIFTKLMRFLQKLYYEILYLQYVLNAVRPLTLICTTNWAVNSILQLTVTGSQKLNTCALMKIEACIHLLLDLGN